MAYDPKSYLNRALKEGFQPVYSQPASAETGEAPQYQGDVATFGNVQVRPLSELVGQTEQDPGVSQQTGYAVSSPLTGQYQGYFRNDIYDNDGNFVKTTISEPDTDKYGLKSLAQLGLTAASFGGLGPVGQMLSKTVSGIAALKSGDPLRILSAASNIPGAGNLVPAELKTLMDYAGKAGQVQSALKGDPNAIFGLVTGAAKQGGLGKGFAGELDLSEPIQEGFFAPGGPGYMPSDTAAFPEDFGYVEQSGSSMPPNELNRFLEANIEDPKTVEELMQTYYPDVMRDTRVSTAPRSIRDVGNVTTITPVEPLEGADITMPDLSKNLPTVQGGTKTGSKTTTKPTAPSGLDLSALAFMLGMNQQRPEEEEQQAASPFPEYDDLMYGLKGRYA